MTSFTLGAVLALTIIALLAYDRIRYGKAVGTTSKANTVKAIESANSAEYQRMVTTTRLFDAVISDILSKE